MLVVVIPTLNAADALRTSLPPVLDGMIEGVVNRLVITDGGSIDGTADIAREAGAELVSTAPGRGGQLAAGADHLAADWYLFLHADSVMVGGWEKVVNHHVKTGMLDKAAAFRLRFDDRGFAPRLLEKIVAVRCWLLALPYGDQGLLISSSLYREAGGFNAIPLMEDVDIVRRIGRKRLVMLDHDIVTSAARYRKEGYLRRMLKNLTCLTMWFAGASPEKIARVYK